MGFQTTLLDNRDKPGGRAYVYEIDGFKFDGGPTVITDPDCLEELFTLTKRKMDRSLFVCVQIKPFITASPNMLKMRRRGNSYLSSLFWLAVTPLPRALFMPLFTRLSAKVA